MVGLSSPDLLVDPVVLGSDVLPIPPTTLIIFGVTGDLAQRKLLPALYNLASDRALPERFDVIGVSRRELGDDGLREQARAAIERFSRRPPDPVILDGLLRRLRHVAFHSDDPEGYARLRTTLDEIGEGADRPPQHLFYLSTAPDLFPVIVSHLGEAGLSEQRSGDVRVVIEKPFGHDLLSARSLHQTVHRYLRESQVFRIDHYLGKETVQNLLAFRLTNSLFEPVWNRNFIDHVQITVAEDLGIGSRAGYYDSAGALRDLVQNHMLQLLALVCMEPPSSFDAKAVRDEKVKVLEAIARPTPEYVALNTVRAQYAAGIVDGERVPGYLDEEGVPPDSRTETYTALRLEVLNWRWAGVPFFLRTGKRLARRVTEIAVQLHPVPHVALQTPGSMVQPNRLVITVQPNEGVSLSLGAKQPGLGMRIEPVEMEFRYRTSFRSESPEAYERLILDAMRGDATLFTRIDEVDAQWSVVTPILEAWAGNAVPMSRHPAGLQGPSEADRILGDQRRWREV